MRIEHDSDIEVEAELPSLEEMIPRDVWKKLRPKERKRQEVLNGLCQHISVLYNSLKIFSVLQLNSLLQYWSLLFNL